jgi:pheromone shutdown protein TraB
LSPDSSPDLLYLDFVAARECAEAVDAALVLGDRPIEITLERAWYAMRWGERLRLGALLCSLPLRRRAATAPADAPSGEAVPLGLEEMGALLAEHFPGLARSLLHERDTFLALTCKSSKAVNNRRLVVGVMGAGHVPGVARALGETQPRGAFKELTWTPRRARARERVLGVVPANLADRLVSDAAITLGLYAASQLVDGAGWPTGA